VILCISIFTIFIPFPKKTKRKKKVMLRKKQKSEDKVMLRKKSKQISKKREKRKKNRK